MELSINVKENQNPLNMALINYVNRLQKLDRLIRLKATGNPKELAKKLGLSERIIYEYINTMKEMDAPIRYSFTYRSYVYTEEGNFNLGFKVVSEYPSKIN